jgi:hypothetical protein
LNDAALHAAILRVLARWGSLPETDLLRWLAPEQVVNYGPGVLQALTDAGLVSVRAIGDERVVKLTDEGRAQAGAGQAL